MTNHLVGKKKKGQFKTAKLTGTGGKRQALVWNVSGAKNLGRAKNDALPLGTVENW